jgi:nitric oxide reductase subunit B
MPPIPASVVDTNGRVVVAAGDIERGQNVWQAMGGMEVGSVWCHGSYIAPDWTADWLHRETSFVLDRWATAEFGKPYAGLAAEDQAKLRGRLEDTYRRNGYDASGNVIRIEPVRGAAFEACLQHFSEVFMQGNSAYAIPAGSISTPERMRQFADSFSGRRGRPPPTGPATASPTRTTGRMSR